jgi:hypothetical protein
MTYPSFNPGDVLFASDQNAVGLWLVTTASVTNQTSITIDDCFSSNYKNYRILGNFSCSIAINLAMTLRDSGGDVTLNNYRYAEAQLGFTGPAWALAANNAGANFPTLARTNDNGSESTFYADLMGPNTATRTSIFSTTVDQIIFRMMNGQYNANTAMTGFKLSSGTAFTGTFRVYGYRN